MMTFLDQAQGSQTIPHPQGILLYGEPLTHFKQGKRSNKL